MFLCVLVCLDVLFNVACFCVYVLLFVVFYFVCVFSFCVRRITVCACLYMRVICCARGSSPLLFLCLFGYSLFLCVDFRFKPDACAYVYMFFVRACVLMFCLLLRFVVDCVWCVCFVLFCFFCVLFRLCALFLCVSFSFCVCLYIRVICCVCVSSPLLFFVCLAVFCCWFLRLALNRISLLMCECFFVRSCILMYCLLLRFVVDCFWCVCFASFCFLCFIAFVCVSIYVCRVHLCLFVHACYLLRACFLFFVFSLSTLLLLVCLALFCRWCLEFVLNLVLLLMVI